MIGVEQGAPAAQALDCFNGDFGLCKGGFKLGWGDIADDDETAVFAAQQQLKRDRER